MMVAEALAGGVTVAGLTVQAGVAAVAWFADTWHVRSTVPVKPFSVPTVMFEEAVPPGATASGEIAVACRVKSCADASKGAVRKAAIKHASALPGRRTRILGLDFNSSSGNSVFGNSDLNMGRFSMGTFGFKVLRFPEQHKGCPAPISALLALRAELAFLYFWKPKLILPRVC